MDMVISGVVTGYFTIKQGVRGMDRKEILLRDQARRCDKLDELQREYQATNDMMELVHEKIDSLQREDELLNNQMTSIRCQITLQEKKIREINKMLRDDGDPTRMPT
jgi:septal ring factor EnvC (AmiA/AmiB activator)